MSRRSRRQKALARIAFTSVLLVACGSRTGLFGEEEGIGFTSSGGTSSGSFDASVDVRFRLDGSIIEPRDGDPPPLDARPPSADVYRADCPDADALLVYTITDDNRLQSFNPAEGVFRDIGRISCPSSGTPFSMAVDRKGTAFILFTDSKIYRTSTATGACIGTPYQPRQSNFARFGMGFATNSIGPTEKLFVAGDESNVLPGEPEGARGIASIDPTTFKLTVIGDDPRFDSAELTGTGDGRLFAFYKTEDRANDSYIGEVDTETGVILGERHFPDVEQGRGWAFSFWGGDFYMFHAPDAIGSTIVTRWRPSDDSVLTVAKSDSKIVGAGVSTCAPQN